MKIHVLENADSVADLASATIARWLREPYGRTNLGLAGGGSPRTTYVRLRDEDVDWDSVDIWLSDERWVSPDDPDSNSLMARRALADHVPATFHPVPWEVGDPRRAATAYEQTLRNIFGTGPGVDPDGSPPAGVVLLGIGDDGHTASLFPGSATLGERDRLIVADFVESKDAWRITATLPVIWSARRLAFIVTGAGKAEVVADILERDVPHPAALAAQGASDVTWFLDQSAAARLANRPRSR